ncbi:hydroxyethylthiazole kinase [Scopulibacillus darangshiensis]|uniref:Hydroxyethylthiazole kinase n=1 Tax=Scopulibacillus darangshiensis TaxID=442528 RepID=A0A4R2NRY5_9BACL|nr:hydroxyethylthiazole kinase [Scopulibacillus darangshiensis]TCP24512.1 hydroxyethylthiazole kinase [Scopulibacillus darangshiensis]
MTSIKNMAVSFQKINDQPPLVHHITNVVTVNDCANVTLALGGRPVMADSPEEAGEMVSMASSLVINIGTLHANSSKAMINAGLKANERGIPIIFDPVGVGATEYRKKTADYLLKKLRCSVICGNMSEMMAIAGEKTQARGVDSGDSMASAKKLASGLAAKLGATIAITGPRDVVSDGERTVSVANGHPMLANVTGTGCMTNSLIGVFAGSGNSPFDAAVAGIAAMGLAGEKAYQALCEGEGVGTFKVRLFDALSTLTPEEWQKGVQIY